MKLRWTRSLLVASVVLGLAVGCSDPASRSIRILTPTNGASLSEADDLTAALAGVQIDVTAELSGFSEGELITLVVNDNTAEEITRSYDGGVMVFSPVTLDSGENVIEVSGGGVRGTSTVQLTGGGCPRLQFVRPTASARLETRDDADGNPANGFQYDVQVTTDADDGVNVQLFVGGGSVDTVAATSGRADFSSADLLAAYPEPGAAENVTLRVQTETACSSTITVQVVRSVVCSSFTFVEPVDGAVFGVADDENGDPSDGFQQSIVASTDAASGTDVELLIDGSTVGSTTVAGTVLRFESVDIAEGTHVLRVQTSADCGEEISVTVDTGAPTCDITVPTGGFLNAEDDVDAGTAGLQIDFDVASDGGDGQPVRLIIDGDEDGARSVNLAGGHAAFAAVGLAEGDHTARARCQNAIGNVGFSATFTYTVDSLVPTCSLTAPADGTWFNTGDDALTAIDGTQVQATVHAAGDPTATTVSRCGYAPLDPEGMVTLDGSGNGSGYVTLAGPGNEVCCGVQDEAGNVGEARITLNLETDVPQFEIRRPDATTTLILAVDDEGPSDTLCQYTVTVGCSNVGRPVTLYVNTIAQTDATCTASADALGGTATWTSIALPQGTVVLSASGTSVGGLTGTSPDKTVTVDTEPPVLAINTPLCGTVLTPADDTSGTVADGIQIPVLILASDAPVTLNVTSDGTTPITGSPYTAGSLTGGFARYTSVTVVPAGLTFGTAYFAATAVDEHGQSGMMLPSPCTIEVRDVPRVTITAPTDGASLGPSADCNPVTTTFDLAVTVSTNIAAGAGTVELFVAGVSVGTQTYPGTPVTFCVPAADGTSIAIRADGTDPRGTGTATIHATIDSAPPDVPVSDLAIAIFNRRGGILELSWTAPSDAGGGVVVGYQIRCLSATTSAASFDWATAATYLYTGIVAAPGTAESERLSGFPIQRYVTCMVRATDAVGSLGPLGNTPQVQLAFLTQEVLGPAGTSRFGYEIEPLGDINGDTYPDSGVGTSGGNALYLFFGSASAVPSSWGTVISGPVGSSFGFSLAGVGDFNGDTLADIAVGAYASNGYKGAAYVFFGRSSWPASLDTSAANIVLQMDDPSSTRDDFAGFGWRVAAAGDNDGDTLSDLIVNATNWNAGSGGALLLFGRASAPATITVPGDGVTGFVGDKWFTSAAGAGGFGSSASCGYRLNGDTYDDLAFGEPGTSTGGSVYIRLGRARPVTTGLVGVNTYDQQIVSPVTGSNVFFGTRLMFGDANGDSRPDLFVYLARPPGFADDRGAVLAFLNVAGALPATYSGMLRNDLPSNTTDRLGLRLGTGVFAGTAAISDLSGDGRSDLFAGMNRRSGVAGTGALFVGRDFSTTVDESTSDLVVPADPADTLSTGSAGYIGDINGDGYPDAAVGHDRHSANRGRIILVY